MSQPDTVDVLIIGAGISGIGAGAHLTRQLPDKSFTIIESRESAGGTWDLFRYPGIRSDSDLLTFAYDFKPWRDTQAIADADRILAYLHETVDEYGFADRIRYGQRVVAANWSSESSRWLVEIERIDTGERSTVSASWVFSGAGYYKYGAGYRPEFPGEERFTGTTVHPQQWPADLDYAGKRVVVIGSGATAVTLVPSMAKTAAGVTMLQRTPTYVVPLGREDKLVNALRSAFGDTVAYRVGRAKNIARQRALYEGCMRFPKTARRLIRAANKSRLPKDFPVDTHFNPPYDPWDQRLCVVPDGDLYTALSDGSASVVTDHIETFTETGIKLTSGTELPADIIVTATGLNLSLLDGIDLSVDGTPVTLSDSVIYKGAMLSGIPNFVLSFGYTNSSWTLKVGLICDYLCRLIGHMDERGLASVRPAADPSMPTLPAIDFGAGYVQRAASRLPRQGESGPWRMSMSYYHDRRALKKNAFDDPALRYGRPVPAVSQGKEPVAQAS